MRKLKEAKASFSLGPSVLDIWGGFDIVFGLGGFCLVLVLFWLGSFFGGVCGGFVLFSFVFFGFFGL